MLRINKEKVYLQLEKQEPFRYDEYIFAIWRYCVEIETPIWKDVGTNVHIQKGKENKRIMAIDAQDTDPCFVEDSQKKIIIEDEDFNI